MKKLALWSLAFTIFAGPWPLGSVTAQDEILKEEGKLTRDDPLDKKLKGHHKTFDIKLLAGQFVRIELKSTQFPPLVRVQSADGKILVQDRKSGNVPAKVVLRVVDPGTFHVIATCADAARTGDFVLTVAKANLKERGDALRGQANSLAKMKKAAQSGYLKDLKEYLNEKGKSIDAGDVALAFRTCKDLEAQFPLEIGAIYDDMLNLLTKSPRVSSEGIVSVMKGVARRTPGHEISVLKGTTAKGEEFDWKSYRGKVVLIDFWATWCGPCCAEVPNVLKLYEKYHDKGFEVVGICIDQDKEALERFLEKEKLPWVCLHEAPGKSSDTMAKLYSLQSPPLAILVGRDGKVIHMRARGSELARLLEKQLAN